MLPVERPALSRKLVWDPDGVAVPVVRPAPSRNVVWPPLVVEVPTCRPALSRNVVEVPDFVAVPVTRPALSRNVVEFPDVVEVPVIRPLPSRNVVVFPEVETDPVVLPELSVSEPRSPLFPETPSCFVGLSLPGGRGLALVSAIKIDEFAMTVKMHREVTIRPRIMSPLPMQPVRTGPRT